MQEFTGQIKKLIGQFNQPIEYYFPIGEEKILLNTYLGKKISIKFEQAILCIQCHRKTSKSFQQGYCYPCYRKLLDCNLCIIHPQNCNYPHNECPDTWEHEHCKQEHIVYLANSSDLKVGITRSTQIPTRWIDQGAGQAIPLFKVSNRNLSGQIEVLFKKFIADKTNWRKMLSKEHFVYDMDEMKEELLLKAREELSILFSENSDIEQLNTPSLTLSYPVLSYPQKLKALSLDKDPIISGELLGIKGQYLILDNGVINIRKHAGYVVTFSPLIY